MIRYTSKVYISNFFLSGVLASSCVGGEGAVEGGSQGRGEGAHEKSRVWHLVRLIPCYSKLLETPATASFCDKTDCLPSYFLI